MADKLGMNPYIFMGLIFYSNSIMIRKMSDKKVLVIDDEDFIRELVKDFLEMDEVQCSTADTPEMALTLVTQERFNLILLDRNLGKIKAEDLIIKLKSEQPGVPILILTGDQHIDEKYIKEVKAEGVIFKPFQIGEFLQTVKKYLEIR